MLPSDATFLIEFCFLDQIDRFTSPVRQRLKKIAKERSAFDLVDFPATLLAPNMLKACLSKDLQ